MCVHENLKKFFLIFILEQEESNEAKSLSLHTKDPVPVCIDVLAGKIDGK